MADVLWRFSGATRSVVSFVGVAPRTAGSALCAAHGHRRRRKSYVGPIYVYSGMRPAHKGVGRPFN